MLSATTKVPASRTIHEICELLVKKGATSINTRYGPDGNPNGLSWAMKIRDTHLHFELPVRLAGVEAVLVKEARSFEARKKAREATPRIAWRQLLRWVEVQMAMIEIGMVDFAQVFLPYMLAPGSGKTMWALCEAETFKQIEAPKC